MVVSFSPFVDEIISLLRVNNSSLVVRSFCSSVVGSVVGIAAVSDSADSAGKNDNSSSLSDDELHSSFCSTADELLELRVTLFASPVSTSTGSSMMRCSHGVNMLRCTVHVPLPSSSRTIVYTTPFSFTSLTM